MAVHKTSTLLKLENQLTELRNEVNKNYRISVREYRNCGKSKKYIKTKLLILALKKDISKIEKRIYKEHVRISAFRFGA